MSYFFNDNRPQISPLLQAPAAHLLVLLVLSSIISGTDLYLHASTKAVSMNFTTALYQDSPANSLRQGRPIAAKSEGALTSPLQKFGAALNTTFCPGGILPSGYFDVDFESESTCSLFLVDPNFVQNVTDFKSGQSFAEIIGLETAIQVYNNQSDLFRVYDVDGVLFLGPASDISNVDFKASSVGIKTECQSITNQCQFTNETIHVNGTLGILIGDIIDFLVYDCPSPNETVRWEGWYIPAFRAVEVKLFENPPGAPLNSFWYGTSVVLDVQSPSIQTGKITVLGDDLVQSETGIWITIQICNSTVLDVNYTFYSNTSSFHIDTISPSEQIVAITAAAPFGKVLTIVQAGVQYAAQVAVASSNTYLDSFAAQLSRLAISLTSGVFMPVPSLSEAWWETQIITRIPIAPLMFLEIFLFTYAVFGLALGCFAWFAYSKSQRPLGRHNTGRVIDNESDQIPLTGISAEMLSTEVICKRLIDPATVITDELFDDPLGKSGVIITGSTRGDGKRGILGLQISTTDKSLDMNDSGVEQYLLKEDSTSIHMLPINPMDS